MLLDCRVVLLITVNNNSDSLVMEDRSTIKYCGYVNLFTKRKIYVNISADDV